MPVYSPWQPPRNRARQREERYWRVEAGRGQRWIRRRCGEVILLSSASCAWRTSIGLPELITAIEQAPSMHFYLPLDLQQLDEFSAHFESA